MREQKDDWQRFGDRHGVQWTPTILIVDPEGVERHRVEGFLPAADLLAQLSLGLAKSAFARQRFADAEKLFRSVVEQFPASDAAAEALYWAGVARYQATNDASALAQTAEAFTRQYRDSAWAKKSSVWQKS